MIAADDKKRAAVIRPALGWQLLAAVLEPSDNPSSGFLISDPDLVNAAKAILIVCGSGPLEFDGQIDAKFLDAIQELALAAGVDLETGELSEVLAEALAMRLDGEMSRKNLETDAGEDGSASGAPAIDPLRRLDMPPIVVVEAVAGNTSVVVMNPKTGWRLLLRITCSSEGKLPDGVVDDLREMDSESVRAAQRVLIACGMADGGLSECSGLIDDAFVDGVRKLAEAAGVDPVTGQWPGSEDMAAMIVSLREFFRPGESV
jgi:hypothetical protein